MANYDPWQYNCKSMGADGEGYAVTMLPRDAYGKLVFQDRQSYQSYPIHWMSSFSIQNVESVELSQESAEYRHIHGFTSAGMPAAYKIQRIFRIQNWYLWQKYATKRVEMEKKYRTAEGIERLLFHGTDCRNIDSICVHGFDGSLCVNSSIGHGTYFAKNWARSHHHVMPVEGQGDFPNVVQRAVVQPPPPPSQFGASYSNQLLWKVVQNHRPLDSNPVLVRPSRSKNPGGVASSQAPDPLHWQAKALPHIAQNSTPPQLATQGAPQLPLSEARACTASDGAAQPFGLHGDPLQGSSYIFTTATTAGCVYQLLIPRTLVPLLQQAVDFLSHTGYGQESAEGYVSVSNPLGSVVVRPFLKYLQALLQLATNERPPPLGFPRSLYQQPQEGPGFIPFQVKHPPPSWLGDVFYVTWPGCDLGEVPAALSGFWFEPTHSPVGPQVCQVKSSRVKNTFTWPSPPPQRTLRPGVEPSPRIRAVCSQFYMFVARVLVCRSKRGAPDCRKPPRGWEQGPLADSCVDSEGHPAIFVVFDDQQTYPEYVVEYLYHFGKVE